jgi:hypothetical protein
MTTQTNLSAECHGLRIVAAEGDVVVNNLAGTAFTQGSTRLQSDGSPWRPLVHVEDISRAFVTLLEAPRDVIHNEAFNVGRDEDVVQIRTIAEQVSEITGAPVSLAEVAGPDTRNYQVDFTKIRSRVRLSGRVRRFPRVLRRLARCRRLRPDSGGFRGPHAMCDYDQFQQLAAEGRLHLSDLRLR